jgi:hypothetical protein
MDNALMQMFSRTGHCKNAAVFTNSTEAMHSILEIDMPPSERFTEIHLSIKELKGLQKDIKFQSQCGLWVTKWQITWWENYESAKRLLINYHSILIN